MLSAYIVDLVLSAYIVDLWSGCPFALGFGLWALALFFLQASTLSACSQYNCQYRGNKQKKFFFWFLVGPGHFLTFLTTEQKEKNWSRYEIQGKEGTEIRGM